MGANIHVCPESFDCAVFLSSNQSQFVEERVDQSTALKLCISQFTDPGDYRRVGRNHWLDESGTYHNSELKPYADAYDWRRPPPYSERLTPATPVSNKCTDLITPAEKCHSHVDDDCRTCYYKCAGETAAQAQRYEKRFRPLLPIYFNTARQYK